MRVVSDGLDHVPVNFSAYTDQSVAACATEWSYPREVPGARPDSYPPCV